MPYSPQADPDCALIELRCTEIPQHTVDTGRSTSGACSLLPLFPPIALFQPPATKERSYSLGQA